MTGSSRCAPVTDATVTTLATCIERPATGSPDVAWTPKRLEDRVELTTRRLFIGGARIPLMDLVSASRARPRRPIAGIG